MGFGFSCAQNWPGRSNTTSLTSGPGPAPQLQRAPVLDRPQATCCRANGAELLEKMTVRLKIGEPPLKKKKRKRSCPVGFPKKQPQARNPQKGTPTSSPPHGRSRIRSSKSRTPFWLAAGLHQPSASCRAAPHCVFQLWRLDCVLQRNEGEWLLPLRERKTSVSLGRLALLTEPHTIWHSGLGLLARFHRGLTIT